MKKYLRIILPLLVLTVFIIIGTSMAFADSDIPVKAMINSSTSKPAYGEFLPAGDGEYLVYPVKATATGKLWVDAKASMDNQYGVSVVVGTYDKEKKEINYNSSYTGYVNSGETNSYPIGCFDVVKGKTYYVGLKGISETVSKVKVRAYIYSYTNNRTLKASSKYLLSSAVQGNGNGKTTIKYKVVPKKTGVMTVTLKDYGLTSSSGYVTLLSKGKKAVSEKLLYSSDSDSYKVRFGVKKGTTYYLKVSDTYGSSSEAYKYGIKYSIKAATDRAISKKSKAKNLKRKASATSTLFTATGKKETDWYKIKVTSKRKTEIKIDATQIRYGSDSKLTITCYRGSKKLGDSKTLYAGDSATFMIYYGDYSKAAKGTYYIKVVKSAKLSGKYSIKYVK